MKMKIQPAPVNHEIEYEKVAPKVPPKVAPKVPSKVVGHPESNHTTPETQITNNTTININLNLSPGFQYRGQHSFESGLLNLLQELSRDRVIEEALRILDTQA
jgi:hypothetical protein